MINRQTVNLVPTLPQAFATGVLTSNNTNVSDADTVTIGTRVYTFKTALTDGIVADEILIGLSADASLTNLARAINLTGTPGTDYGSATTINTQVAASTVASHAITVTAKLAGNIANSIATTKSAATLTWGDTTLDGGAGGAMSNITLDVAQAYTTDPFDVQTYIELIAFMKVYAHAGTNPTLDCKFQVSPDGSNWADVGDSFTQVTTGDTLTFKRLTANFGRYMRAIVTLAGTLPSYRLDFTVVGKI